MKNLRTGTAKFDTIRAKDANGLSIQDDGGNGIFIKDGGNVGIGITSPNAKLQVEGDIRVAHNNPIEWGGTAYSIVGNATTGYLQFNTSSSESMRIDSDGNVGIGTTNPISILHVNKSINTTNTGLTISNYDNTAGTNQAIRLDFGLARNSGALKPYAGSILVGKEDDWVSDDKEINSFMSFNVFGENAISEKMRITSKGNVGIGTTNPTNGKLEILNPTATVATTDSVDLAITQNASGTSSKVQLRAGVTSGDDPYFSIRTRNRNDASSEPGAIKERMRITHTGNVGIGTTNPSTKLTALIENDSTYDNVTPNSANSVLGLINNPTNEAANNHATLQFNLNAGTHNHVGSISLISESNTLRRGALAFCTDNGTTRPEVMRIDSAGNVGIGTTNPGNKLHIAQGTLVGGSTNSNTSLTIEDALNTGIQFLSATQTQLRFGDADSDGAGSIIYQHTDNLLRLNTTGAIALQGGNVGIGTTNPSSELHIHGNNSSSPKLIIDSGSVTYGSSISFTADSERAKITGGYDTGGGGYIQFNADSAGGSDVARMRINNAGNVAIYSLAASADVVTNANKELTTSSDKRLKNDLGDCEYGLTEILQVYPKKYTWKEGSDDQQATVGFFAQDVYPIMPEAAPREAIQNENGEDDYKWGLNSQTIIAALVNATKEQQAIIEDLKSQNASLESRISALES